MTLNHDTTNNGKFRRHILSRSLADVSVKRFAIFLASAQQVKQLQLAFKFSNMTNKIEP
jgi:hypothetical protein